MNTENAITVPVRDINTISTEIKMIRENVRKVALEGAMEIGRRLCEAKELIPFGEWGNWLKEEFDYSQTTANRLMTLFREYSADQQSLYGATSNCSTLNNLSVSNALLLVAIPENEREAFASEHDVENLSARELEKLIKEKQAAEREAERYKTDLEKATDNNQRLADRINDLTEERDTAAEMLSERENQLKKLNCDIEEINSRAAAAAEKATSEAKEAAEKEYSAALTAAKKEKAEAEKALKAAQHDIGRYKADLEKIKANPEVPQELIDKVKAQFEEQIKAAEGRAAAAEANLKTAEGKLRVSSPEKQQFIFRTQLVQQYFSELIDIANKATPEEREKMLQAVDAVLTRLHEVRNRG